jgi:hypothetical protein
MVDLKAVGPVNCSELLEAQSTHGECVQVQLQRNDAGKYQTLPG